MKAILQAISPIALQAKFRHRIQIAIPNKTQDSMGGWSYADPTILHTTWGTIEALTGTEKFAAHEFVSQVTHSIFIRNPRSAMSVPVTANMLVLYNKRTFQVEAVLDPDERRKYLQLLCIELNDSQQQQVRSPESAL